MNQITDQTLKNVIIATATGMHEWLRSDNVFIQDKDTKTLLPNAELESTEGGTGSLPFIIKELLKYGIVYETK